MVVAAEQLKIALADILGLSIFGVASFDVWSDIDPMLPLIEVCVANVRAYEPYCAA